ncbi:MAG: FAD-binding protein [Candidatus Andeanibacterium colombiense]|uniref:FAD-binding protein n=1 Tax=Candidatus Andeanibacterium colombiense TaxID=3121345 RepID=A0AAJ5X5B3_9SPHN|nr:MAG: FAD-binding protein [Sphingomonadaceae bacterium]
MVIAGVPSCEDDVADAVADAVRDGIKLSVVGGGSKSGIGRQTAARELPMAGLAGVIQYEPSELVLTARPGTPLAELVLLLAENSQYFAFDPFDHGPMFGQLAGSSTIGGIVAGGVSGSGRISAGAARDHLLGFRAVSGRAEIFAAGGKVVKNVTGFDLSKLATQSWGRLFALTELTLKVMPRPPERITLILPGLGDRDAIRAMSVAMGSQAEVAAAAHYPAAARNGESATIFRIQGFGPSVAARRRMLEHLLADFGPLRISSDREAAAMWECLSTLAPLERAKPLWRISVRPRRAAEVTADFEDRDAAWLFDWAGGLVWLATDADPAFVRAAAARRGGHAALLRADRAIKNETAIFHPPAAGIAALEGRIREAFDPSRVFQTGRF